MSQRLLTLCLSVVLVSAATLFAQKTRHYEVIALQGVPAPSAGSGALYGIMGVEPRIGPSGDVVFGSFVNNNGSANWAIWTGFPGDVSALAVQGDAVPGRAAETFDVFFRSSGSPYWLCNNSAAAFHARTLVSQEEGYWIGERGSLQGAVIEGDQAPGLAPGVLISDIGGFRANGQGEVIFRTKLEGGSVERGDDTAIWAGPLDDLVVIAREGEPVDGQGAGAVYDDLNTSEFSLNAVGRLCFTARLDNVPISSNEVLVEGTRDDLSIILREGGAIPLGDLSGQGWGRFSKPRMNDRGSIVFESTPSSGGARSFFLRTAEGTITRVAEEGAVPPGAPDKTWAKLFFSKPALGGDDAVAIVAGLAPGESQDRDGIWMHRDGVTRLVLKEGDPAPGFPGQTFQEFQPLNQHRAPAVNAEGVIVFQATTNGGAAGIWRWHKGDLRLLITVGDFLDLGPGGVRRVAHFSAQLGSGGQSGLASCLNDRGQFVFRASFNTGALGTAVLLIDDVLDLDGDGVDDLLEEGLGGDPDDRSDGSGILPVLSPTPDGVKLTFFRRTDGSFTHHVECAPDLESWEDLVAVPQVSSDQEDRPPGTERMEVRVPFVDGPRKYLRLRVRRVAP